MELLTPSPPPPSPADHLSSLAYAVGRSSPTTAVASRWWRSDGEGGDVHVEVGRSREKGEGLLRWAFQRFGYGRVVLVHVHQPSPTIPTLLGNIPANQANEEVLKMHRKEEKKKLKRLMLHYVNFCNASHVEARYIVVEKSIVPEGLVDVITERNIRKLVMGAEPDSCMKVKLNISKSSYTAKNAPPFCEIWFVRKGRHVWTREVNDDANFQRSSSDSSFIAPLMQDLPGQLHDVTAGLGSFIINEQHERSAIVQTEPEQSDMYITNSTNSSVINSTDQSPRDSLSYADTISWLTFSSEAGPQNVGGHDLVQDLLNKSRAEVKVLNMEASKELLRRRELEAEVAEAVERVKIFETSQEHEAILRAELKRELRDARRDQKELFNQRAEALGELQNAMKSLAILDNHVQELTLRRVGMEEELSLVEASVLSVTIEKRKINKQREEATNQLENRCCQASPESSCREIVDDPFDFTEFSLSDLQSATCNFSESFKIRQGGYGCVYKGEMLNKTVAIKMLHPQNRQGELEFQQEVHVLSKLRHPHLISLIGACPDSWSLVYDYLPNGSLQENIFRKPNPSPRWTWKARIHAVSEIASALFFLHSSKIIHGDLKPENIFLDANFSCKLGNFRICGLVPEDNIYSPSFRRNSEPKGVFSYKDPEFRRTGKLTSKSDVYSLGIVILQLLTGKPPTGLAIKVRCALLEGNLTSVVDTNAGEWPVQTAVKLADFGLRCCELKSLDRPELTELVLWELEQLQSLVEQHVPHFFLCPILQEIMHDPQVAADGFTYEGRAIRGWLESGKETSPMTNLKLDHTSLTPNHALRFAIQDWLTESAKTKIS